VGAQQLGLIELRQEEATSTRFSRLWPYSRKGLLNAFDFAEEVRDIVIGAVITRILLDE
jgi:hypothetical protein